MLDIQNIDLKMTGWAICGAQWSWSRTGPSLQCYDLWYVVDGAGTVSDGAREWAIQKGDVILYPPQLVMSGWQDQTRRLIVSYSHFHIRGDNPLKTWLSHSRDVLKLATDDPEFMAGLLRRYWLSYEKHGPSGDCLNQLVCALIEIQRLHEAHGLGGDVVERRAGVEGLCQMIREQPHLQWRVDDMAEQLEISGSYFNKLFRVATGMSPKRFVIQCRITQAQSLLMMTDLPLTQIASRLGYADAFTFSKQFQREVGMSPSQWRIKPNLGLSFGAW